jgi:hypothetical protein
MAVNKNSQQGVVYIKKFVFENSPEAAKKS